MVIIELVHMEKYRKIFSSQVNIKYIDSHSTMLITKIKIGLSVKRAQWVKESERAVCL
jgi:hypothetical protein